MVHNPDHDRIKRGERRTKSGALPLIASLAVNCRKDQPGTEGEKVKKPRG